MRGPSGISKLLDLSIKDNEPGRSHQFYMLRAVADLKVSSD